jgi:hypothetical protein
MTSWFMQVILFPFSSNFPNFFTKSNRLIHTTIFTLNLIFYLIFNLIFQFFFKIIFYISLIGNVAIQFNFNFSQIIFS